MARRGRPQLGIRLIDNLEGTEHAKKSFKAILASITGEWTTEEAAAFLGSNQQRFYALRLRTLRETLRGLEPRKPGRKPKVHDPKDDEIAHLRRELERARHTVQTLDARLALVAAGVRPRSSKKRS